MANPNPSPETRFKPGESGNPSGRSTEEQKAHLEAAKIAANLKLKALSSLQELVDRGEMTELELIKIVSSTDVRGLIVEAENRAHGTPKQQVDLNAKGSFNVTINGDDADL